MRLRHHHHHRRHPPRPNRRQPRRFLPAVHRSRCRFLIFSITISSGGSPSRNRSWPASRSRPSACCKYAKALRATVTTVLTKSATSSRARVPFASARRRPRSGPDRSLSFPTATSTRSSVGERIRSSSFRRWSDQPAKAGRPRKNASNCEHEQVLRTERPRTSWFGGLTDGYSAIYRLPAATRQPDARSLIVTSLTLVYKAYDTITVGLATPAR